MKENLIKHTNLKKIRELLKSKKIATKPELAALSGLSVVTVNSLVKTLLDCGEITEDKSIQPELGRPALSYRFNEVSKLVLVIYMFETNNDDIVCYSVCNLYGDEIETLQEKNKITTQCFDKNIQYFLNKYNNIQTIGFSIPGVEYNDEFIICDYPDIDKKFPKIIKDRYDVDIFIENDINSAILGYYMCNNCESIVGIYMPSKYPPGSSICLNGKILKGKNNLAGEIKYLPCDIDWSKLPLLEKDMENFLLNVVKIYMCVYNPEQIVIYADISENKLEQRMMSLISTDNEKLMLPRLMVKKDLNIDIKKGLISNALSRINL